MQRFRLIATGGTIASQQSPRGLLAGATGEELLAASGLDSDRVEYQVEVENFYTKGSYALELAHLVELARRAQQALADGVDGVVITHGTDSMEESAFLLDLVHDDPRPVVLTGAQRPFDSPSPDGATNLAAAFDVAASPQARGLGTLLVFDGLAWQARGVRKVETLAAAAFAAPGRGPCLRITPGGVIALSSGQPRPAPWDLERIGALPRVDVVAAYLGSDDVLLDAAVAAGARGVVLQALGAGNTPPVMTDAVARLVSQGIPVLVSSRVVTGPVSPLYTGGGGADLAKAGAVFVSDLSPWQARLLLSAALALSPENPASLVADWLRQADGTSA